MSELMDSAVIGMPFEMAMSDELSRRQFYSRAQSMMAERDQLRAEVEALRGQKVDWQAECLKKGFEYVRESDDHYVVASPAEMVTLLRDLLGVDVRHKDGSDYGVSVAELEEQVEGLVNTIHSLEPLREHAHLYRHLRAFNWYESPLAVVRNPKGNVKPGTDCPSGLRLDEAIRESITCGGLGCCQLCADEAGEVGNG